VHGVDKRFLKQHIGRILVRFDDPDFDIEVETFGRWTLLEHVLMAWKHLTNQDRRDVEPVQEAQNWSILDYLFKGASGHVHVRMTRGLG